MKKLIIASFLILTSCMSMQDVRLEKNKTVYELNMGYQEAYRLITTSLSNNCDIIASAIHPIIYVDAGYATISHVLEGVVAWSFDLKDAGPGKSIMEYYTGYPVQQKKALHMQQHINQKVSGCYFDEIK